MEFSRELHRKTIRESAVLTTSYVPAEINSTIDGDQEANSPILNITDASSFPGSGEAVVTNSGTDYLIKWTAKDSNQLQGVTGNTVDFSNADTIYVPALANMEEYNFIGLEVDFTKGSLTSAELKIEVSMDGVNYYQQVSESITAGTITSTLSERTFTETGSYSFLITPVRSKYIRISVKGTGTVTNSLCAITAVWGWA